MSSVKSKKILDDDVSIAIRKHKTASPSAVLKGYGVSTDDPISQFILKAFYISHAFYEHPDDKKRRDDKFSLRHIYEGAVRQDRRPESNFLLTPYMKTLYTTHDWGEDIVRNLTGAIVMEHFVSNLFPTLQNIKSDHHLVTNHYNTMWKQIMAEVNQKKGDIVPLEIVGWSLILRAIETQEKTLFAQVKKEEVKDAFKNINFRLNWFKTLFVSLWTVPDYQYSPNLKLDNLDEEGYKQIKRVLEESMDVLSSTNKELPDIQQSAYMEGKELYKNLKNLIYARKLRNIPKSLLSENESPLEATIRKNIYESLYIGRAVNSSKARLQAGEPTYEATAPLLVKICDAIDNISQLPFSIEKLYTTVRKARAVGRQAFKFSQWMDSNAYNSITIKRAALYLDKRLKNMVTSHKELYRKLAKLDTLYDEDKNAYRNISNRLVI